MTVSHPRLSVVCATYRRPKILERSLRTILDQTFRDFEVVLVDDASGDQTPEVAARLAAADPRIVPIEAPRNLGPGGARNLGIERARGSILAIHDDDDAAHPERFARQIAQLDADPRIDAVASTVRWVDSTGQELLIWPQVGREGRVPDEADELFRLLYLESNKIPNTTFMVRRSALGDLRFLEGVHAGEDWFLVLQLAARGRRFAVLREPLVDMLRGADHSSQMAASARAFAAQRKVLGTLRAWLDAEGIDRFDALHRRALANQWVREGRFWWGWRAPALALRALAIDPTNPSARRALQEALGRLARRALGRSNRSRGTG